MSFHYYKAIVNYFILLDYTSVPFSLLYNYKTVSFATEQSDFGFLEMNEQRKITNDKENVSVFFSFSLHHFQ